MPRRKRCTGRSVTRTKRWSIPIAVAITTRSAVGVHLRRRPPRSSSPGSISRPRRTDPQAATFTELFADLLHPTDSTDPSRLEVGADLHAVLTLSFVEAMTGTERQVVVTRQDLCGACNGTGHVRTTEGRCGSCHGSGSVRWARGHMVFTKTCATCRGTGRRRSERCAVCFGHGRSARTEAVAVHVPPGVQPGSGLRVPRHGHAGRNGGQNGDLFVTVHVEPHPFYHREGDDLHMRVPARRARGRSRRADRCADPGRAGRASGAAGNAGGAAVRAHRSWCAARDGRPRQPDCRSPDRASAAGGRSCP